MAAATVATRLALFLERSGMTRAELARRCGVTPPAITAWLKDGDEGNEPTLERLRLIAKAFDVSVTAFLGRGFGVESTEGVAGEDEKAAG